MHGEIDYDDLFIATVLRFAAPEAYDFLMENIRELQTLESRQNDDSAKKSRTYLKEKWGLLATNVEWDAVAAEKLIAFLFPTWDKGPFSSVQIPQGIRNSYPTNYWQRINDEAIPEAEISDQEILQALRKWKFDHNGIVLRDFSFPEVLYSLPTSSSKLEQFARYFLNPEDIRELATSLFEVILLHDGVKANVDSCPGFLSLWRLSNRMPMGTEGEHGKWILEEIIKALPISLHFANDLYSYWRHNPYVTSKEKTPELRNFVINNFKALFLGKPESFIKSVDPTYIYSTRHFAVLFSDPEYGGDGFEAAEWRWLGYLLLDAAKIQSQITIYQIIPLIIDSPFTISFGDRFEFNSKRAKDLFNDRLQELMILLANMTLDTSLDQGALSQISFAQDVANKWLEQN